VTTYIAAWEIGDGDVPTRMAEEREFLEKHLEGWIEHEPSLLGGDIRWVSRQLVLPDGSRLDLLGLTKDNTWVIAELKAGQVDASTVLQAMHYFLQIAAMSDAELAQRDPSPEHHRRLAGCGAQRAGVRLCRNGA
jgi:RecB family endonuclease NucS